MHRAPRIALVAAALSTLAVAGPSAAIEQGGVRMELLIDGRPAEEHAARGKAYVQAFRNKEYAVRLSNDTSGRVAVALAVDGLNSVDARHTTAEDSTKWVLGPWESIVVQGWQVGPDHARKFFFTTEQKSYGEWLGDTRNLGVISVVAFAEKRRAVAQRPAPEPWFGSGRAGWDEDAAAPRTESKSSGGAAEAEASSAPARTGDLARRRPNQPKKDENAATGIGRKLQNEVEWVDFQMDPRPIASLDLRYGFRDELVALGVLPRPRSQQALQQRERAGGFAPDPGGWHHRR